MSEQLPDTLRGFVRQGAAPDRSLAVVNRSGPEPVQRLVERTFERTPVDVEEWTVPDEGEDLVLLVEDGDVVAASPLTALQEAVLFVNVDRYRTGTSGFDDEAAPEVLTALDEMAFTLRGFPHSTKEKLLLVVMSREIERRALAAGGGRLDAAFQRLSRMRDEHGTQAVYERLAATDVDVHVYGVPDADPPTDDLAVHAGDSAAYRDSWFVVFEPPAGADPSPAALVAVETGPNTWEATWTYDPARVRRVRRYVGENF